MKHFNMRGVIGKGGMGAKTLAACHDVPGVYFSAIGGAAKLIAQSVQQVLTVYKLDFGVPEAMWVLEVKDFPVVVTMDSHGSSLHAEVEQHSSAVLADLLATA
jgi:fumarate hydratase class I